MLGSDFTDLMRLWPGSSLGAWYLVPNEESVHAQGSFWSAEQGKHPFVLLGEFDPNLPVPARGRSKTVESHFVHNAHPWKHEDTCSISERGWIRVQWSLKPEVIRSEYYSCIEPDDVIKQRLANGEGP